MDNAYDNFIPKWLIVRVINMDRFKDTIIEQDYNKKTGISTFTVSKKSIIRTHIQKRTMHTTTKLVKRSVITPIVVDKNVKLKPFSTLGLETINHNNSEYPIAISMAAGFKDNPIPETQFFTIDKSRLKYNNSILDTD